MKKDFYYKIAFVIIVQCSVSSALFSQKNKLLLDSLEKLTLSRKDTDLVKVYNELTWQYRNVSKDKAIEYGNKAVELGTKLSFNKGIAQGYNDLGILYSDKMDYKKALELYSKSMEIRQKTGDKKGVAGLYSKIGVLHQKKGDFTKAMENQQNALRLYEELKYDFGTSYALNNIAILNYDIGNNVEALRYNFKSVEIKKKIGDNLGLSGSYVNIANIYFKNKNYPDAISYNLKALEICRKTGDKEYISTTLNNLGSVYFKVNDMKNALKCIQESYEIRKEWDDKKGMISYLVNLSHIYLKLNQPKLNYEKLTEALKLSKEISTLPEIASLYGAFTDYYESIGDYKNALKSARSQFAYRDSLLNEDLNSKITEMNVKYETEKRQKEFSENELKLKASEFELTKEKTQRNILLISILLIIVISYVFYSRYRYRQKIVFNQEMLKQQEIRAKAVINAEEKERTRIARELHDGLGQQLSAVKLNMSSLESVIDLRNEEQKILFHNALQIIDDSVKEVRTVSHDMMPNALIKSGLAIAVREFINKISNSDKFKIELEITGLNERLESTMETILYRVLQETINNIIKHSQATLVTIQLIRHDDELTLMIEDNGIGFDVDKVKTDGIGLKNIITRIEYLNGKVHFDSQPKKGTTVIIEIPLK